MSLNRRTFLTSLAAASAASIAMPHFGLAQSGLLTKPIPTSGEKLPLVGLGSWITFNVGDDPVARLSLIHI